MLLTLVAALFASLASAQANPSDPLGATFRDFSGGYVDTVESAGLQPNQSPSALNVVIDDPVGSLKPRNGFTRCGGLPSGNTPTNLYQYAKSDGTKNLIVTDNQNVYSTRDCQTYTTIYSGLSSSAQPYFTTVRDKLWIVNGSTWPIVWDGSTAALLDGRNNTPQGMPKCAYPEFYRERVWCANTSANPSGLYFSAITDSAGNDIDPSTGSLSWPAINLFQINQNGGSPIYGIKAYRDRLYVFKDNGIWEVQFNSEFDNAVRKTFSSAGSRFHSSIVEVDGLLNFVGRDGIYAFDGEQSVRLSRDIEGKFSDLNQPQISTLYKLWTSQSDFSAGTLSSTTVTVIPDAVTLTTQAAVLTNGNFETGSANPWTYQTGGSSNTFGVFTTGNVFANPISGTYSLQALAGCNGNGNAEQTWYLFDVLGSTLTSGTMLNQASQSLDVSAHVGKVARLKLRSDQTTPAAFEFVEVWSGTFTVVGPNVTFTQSNNYNCNTIDPGGFRRHGFIALDDFKNAAYFSSGTWTSDVFNAVTVSSWTTFTANSANNGGSISYEFRVGHDTADISTRTWVSIVPGSLITGATYQPYVQVRASLYANTGRDGAPELDDVSVSYSQGGSVTTKLFAAGWKNRLWISASSGTATTNNLALVKSRLPLNSWSLYDLQIGAMTVFNDLFYAAASTHSAIYRLDYGTNDNGLAIPWYWETRDEMWNAPNARKHLSEIDADFKKGTAENASLGYSLDYGATYTNRPVNMSGTGRGSTAQFLDGLISHSYRLRIFDATIDETAVITGMTGWATTSKLRE